MLQKFENICKQAPVMVRSAHHKLSLSQTESEALVQCTAEVIFKLCIIANLYRLCLKSDLY
jgi:hypothetical protein